MRINDENYVVHRDTRMDKHDHYKMGNKKLNWLPYRFGVSLP